MNSARTAPISVAACEGLDQDCLLLLDVRREWVKQYTRECCADRRDSLPTYWHLPEIGCRLVLHWLDVLQLVCCDIIQSARNATAGRAG